MSDYFTAPSSPVAATLVRAAKFIELIANVTTAFDKLPTEAALKKDTATYGTDTGAADAYLVAMPSAPTAYTDGMEIVFKAVAANTGAATVNVDSLGVVSIKTRAGAALSVGDILAGHFVIARYNSTGGVFELS